jgi:DNA-binding MarR family transcriptional regulator
MTDTEKPEGLWPDGAPLPEAMRGDAEKGLTEEVVWFRLFKLNNLLSRPFFSRFAEKYQITLTDWRIIMTLALVSEGAAHELCDATGMHPMNVSRSLASLRRQGRVAERRDPLNRRRKIITLTEEGRALYEGLMPHLRKFTRFIFGSMSAEDVAAFARLVESLTAHVESVDPGSPLLVDEAALAHPPAAPPARRRGRRLDE